MKKLLVPLILALFLCACTVGPEEAPHNDILNPQSPSASDRPDVSAPAVSSQDVSSEPEPGEDVGETTSEDIPIPDEPEDVLEIPDEELSSAVGGCGSYGPAVNRKCPWCGNGI